MAGLEAVIGMEVHAELLTRSKMFCACATEWGAPPNTQVCPVCLGLPGSLPVPNEAAVELALRTALALGCRINRRSVFHRKNYFYPDLPKAYQISQYDLPIGVDGALDVTVSGTVRRVRIRRVHLEEDTGKLLHATTQSSFVDYNRSGVPLLEIVTEPDIRSADEAREYLTQLRRVLLYVGASDCRMEQGSMRCEPNISVRPAGTEELNAKAELKNLNSFRVVHLGVQYEVARQGLALERERGLCLGAVATLPGPPPMKVNPADLALRQETRRWDDTALRTVPMRVKESAHDYRYFPEPDLAPLMFDEARIEQARARLPELPGDRAARYRREHGLSEYDAGVIADERGVADYYDAAVLAYAGEAKKIANWLQSDWMRLFNAGGRDLSSVRVRPGGLAELVRLVDAGEITGKQAKDVFEAMWEGGESAADVILRKGIRVVGSEDSLLPIVDRLLAEHDRMVRDILEKGQEGKINALIGFVMRETRGSAKPELVRALVRRRLGLPE